MRKLDILIPQYKETDEIIRPLLDSIALQQNVDFKDVGVIICNDGSDTFLSEELLNSYPFAIEYHKCEHGGVSATRNACLDHSKADYVMFCDADDMFYSICGLYIVFREMGINNGFDTLSSNFIEETRDQNGNVVYINREMDSTFVHGKVHRRKYLLNNNIRWNDSLTIHEDSYFNCLCQKLIAKEDRGRYCPMPFYLWKWRDESVCRHDKLYLNKTMVNMLASNTALVNEFLDRGREDLARFYAVAMIYDTYYSLQCDRWWEGEGKEYLPKTNARMKEYLKDFKYLLEKTSKEEQLMIASGIRQRFFSEGLLHEKMTFEDWIQYVEA
jgi:glycosyltransferase involved in cell wall biosynthesis